MSGRLRQTRARRADLSQHFLREARAARLVKATSITHSDFVIEIGAGRGALTKPLLKRTRQLRAVEIDPYLAEKLRASLGDQTEVVAADFLRLQLPDCSYKVIGNIPFSVTTEIVRKLVDAPNPPEDAWLVVQREPAWRLCGRPYTPETLWSLRLKPQWHIEIIDRLQRNDFDPPPKVDSVLLWMSRRGRPLLSRKETRRHDEILSSVFGSRHRSIGPTFRPWLSKLQLRRLARDLKFDVDANISTLVFEQWLGIVRLASRQ